MSQATEQRVKDKLKQLSKASNTPFNLLLDTLFLERFLVRIGQSAYADKLIFKGGMCLAQFIDIGRETKDIDFLLTQIEGSIDTIKTVIEEIAILDVGDDFIFSSVSVVELSLQHKKYPGYRITVQGQLGQIKNKVSIDIGVGDVVRPRVLDVELMGSNAPLFEDSITLSAYPPEYIFSEKVEAILYLGELNSRMKDFYDCYQLIRRNGLDAVILKAAISETLENRGTPLSLIPESIDVFDARWKAFLRKNKIDELNLNDVIAEINKVMKDMIKA